jgi:hypothetical protein
MYLYDLRLLIGRVSPRAKIHIVPVPGGADLDGFRSSCKRFRFRTKQVRLAEPGDDIHLCDFCCFRYFDELGETKLPDQEAFRETIASCTRAHSVEVRALPYPEDPNYVLLPTKDLDFAVELLRRTR